MSFWGAKTPLPDVWTMLPNLTSFMLMEPELVTPFPADLCDHLRMVALLMYYATFTTPIPDSCYQESLFALVFVGVSGPLELSAAIGRSVNMVYLSFFSTSLTGRVPDEVGNLSQLSMLMFANNPISCYTPSSLRNMSRLQVLAFEGSSNAPCPFQLMNESNELAYIFLSGLDLRGLSTLEWIVWQPKLLSFVVINSIVNDSLPSSFPLNANISYVVVRNAHVTGELSSSFVEAFPNAVLIDISDNNLTGALPASISDLTKMTVFNVSVNQFSGVLPALSKCTSLKEVDASFNADPLS